MAQQGKIAKKNDNDLRSWDPESILRRLSHQEARFSRGFLTSDPTRWFDSIEKHWVPLFHFLETDISFYRLQLGFDLPPYIERQRVFEIDGELAIMGMSTGAVDALVDKLEIASGSMATDVVLEYIERRILSSITRSWCAGAPLKCQYLSRQPRASVDVVGVVGLNLAIGDSACTVTLGLGPKAVEKLDILWKKQLLDDRRRRGENILRAQIYSVIIDLTELAVAPAMLIDYMRSGTLIDLEVPLSTSVLLRLDGRLWGEGELCQYNGNYAVVVKRVDLPARSFPEGTTKVRVEIGRVDLDHEGLVEHSQSGAVLVTGVSIDSNASLVISGENVATAVVQ